MIVDCRATFMSFLFLITACNLQAQPPQHIVDLVVKKVNEVRSKSLRCGNKVMPPVKPIKWNNMLHETAKNHAMEMEQYNYFGHKSINGLDVSERFDKYGYFWRNAGENLGEGQKYFEQVLTDWIKSPSHCKTLMHPDMEDMGVAKYGKYWVQHFGRHMPPGHKRVNERYTENN